MELAILQFFENLRADFLTLFACLFTLFGETVFLIVLVCLLYWLYDKSLGEKLVIVSFSSMCFNGLLKNVVARPRPYVSGGVSRVELHSPLLSTVSLEPYQSFPSGHSQLSAGMFFTGAFHFRKKVLWIIFPLCTLFVMLSRLYLGVHYPSDVLVGAAFGVLFACAWEWVFQKSEKSKYYILVGFALLSILFSAIAPSKHLIELCGCCVASAICLPFENKWIRFENQPSFKKKFYRLLLGLSCVGVVFGAFSVLPFAFLELWGWKFVKYFLTVITGALLVPYLFVKLKI